MTRSRFPWRIYGLVLPTWLVLGIFFLVPLAIMLLVSFAQRSIYGAIKPVDDLLRYLATGEFLANYLRTLEPGYIWIAWRSLWMAIATTLLCILVAFPVAYYIALVAPARRRNLLLALTVIPFWTSFLIRTYAWMLILRTEGLVNVILQGAGIIHQPLDLLYNNFAVMIGLVYGELPFMILPLYASLEKLDRTLLEASADLGAARASTFRRITLPLSAPGMAAGIVLVFIPALGQFIVSDLLGGAKTMLLGNLIQNQFVMARNSPFGSALAFELIAAVVAFLLLYGFYARRRGSEVLL